MKVTFVVKDLDDLTNVTPGNDMGMLPAARQANHQVGMSRFGPQVFVLQKITWGSDAMKNQDNSFPSKKIRWIGRRLSYQLPQPGGQKSFFQRRKEPLRNLKNNLHFSYLLIFLLL